MTAVTAVRAAIQARRTRHVDTPAESLLQRLRDSLFVLGGLASCSIAAFEFTTIAGWVAVGISLFVLDVELSS